MNMDWQGISLAQHLWQQFEIHKDRIALSHHGSLDKCSETFGDLQEKAVRLASALAFHEPKIQRVLLCVGPGRPFIVGLLACLFAGKLVAPCFAPQGRRNKQRFQVIQDSFQADLVLCDDQNQHQFPCQLNVLDINSIVNKSCKLGALDRPFSLCDRPVIAQFTSGSTANPKGILLTDKNVLSNLHALITVLGFNSEKIHRTVTWLPPYHDLGLFANILLSLSIGGHLVVMRPIDFLRRPISWFQALSDTKAHYSCGPDFAFRMILRRVKEDELEPLDLSQCASLALAAEPVRASTISAVFERFKPCGLKPATLRTAYGLAESTVLVAASKANEAPRIRYFDRHALMQNNAVLVDKSNAAVPLVSNGAAIESATVIIGNPPALNPNFASQIGEIHLSGPSIATHYLDAKGGTQALLEKGKLATGDLGFIYEGELYVTGRVKDLIIINGENFYPIDIERSFADLLDDNANAAAFSFQQQGGESRTEDEIFVIVAERPAELEAADFLKFSKRIADRVVEEIGLQLDLFLVVPRRSLPVTSSGKLQRLAIKHDFQNNMLDVIHEQRFHRGRTSLTEERFIELCAEIANVDAVALSVETPLSTVLLDSLGLLNLNLALETEFDCFLEIVEMPATIGDLLACTVSIVTKGTSQSVLHVSLPSFESDEISSHAAWQDVANKYDEFVKMSDLIDDFPREFISLAQQLYPFLDSAPSTILEIARKTLRNQLFPTWFWYLPSMQNKLRYWDKYFPASHRSLLETLRELPEGSILLMAHMSGWDWMMEALMTVAHGLKRDVALLARYKEISDQFRKAAHYRHPEIQARHQASIIDVNRMDRGIKLLNALNSKKLIIAFPDTALAENELDHVIEVPFLRSHLRVASGIFQLANACNLPLFHLDFRFDKNGPNLCLTELSRLHPDNVDGQISTYINFIELNFTFWSQWKLIKLDGRTVPSPESDSTLDLFDRNGIIHFVQGEVAIIHSLWSDSTIYIDKKHLPALQSESYEDLKSSCAQFPHLKRLIPELRDLA